MSANPSASLLSWRRSRWPPLPSWTMGSIIIVSCDIARKSTKNICVGHSNAENGKKATQGGRAGETRTVRSRGEAMGGDMVDVWGAGEWERCILCSGCLFPLELGHNCFGSSSVAPFRCPKSCQARVAAVDYPSLSSLSSRAYALRSVRAIGVRSRGSRQCVGEHCRPKAGSSGPRRFVGRARVVTVIRWFVSLYGQSKALLLGASAAVLHTELFVRSMWSRPASSCSLRCTTRA